MMDAERTGTEGLTGGCLCGAVRYRTNGPPKRVGVCHCPTCKRQTGSPLPAFAIFAADAVTVTGETRGFRSEEHTSELQSLMRISYAVFCLKKKNTKTTIITININK